MAAPNQWGTLQIQAPALLKPEDVEKVNSVADFLVQILDIGLSALEIGKVATSGSLDPVAAVLKALTEELNRTIRDLEQTGIYLTSDWGLETKQLQGGFQGFEQRMITRLTDRTDPTRPDVSGNTSCLAIYFYVTDEGQVEHVRQFLAGLAAFFQQKPLLISEYPVPKVTQVLYGAKSASLFTFRNITASLALSSNPPDAALVKWKITPATPNGAFQPTPAPVPAGFFVTLSTFPDGITVVYDRPRAGDTKEPSLVDPSVRAQPREYGRVLTTTGEPLVLHGGADMLVPFQDSLSYNAAIRDGVLKDGYTRVYGVVKGDKVIPLDQLKQGDVYFFQRTFYVEQNPAWTWLTEDFATRFTREDLPHVGRIVQNSDGTLTIEDEGVASTVYVRIAACGQDVVKGQFKYVLDANKVGVTGIPITAENSASPGALGTKVSNVNLGRFSKPTQMVFANVHTMEYLEALKTALAVLVLSRPDLEPLDTLRTLETSANYEAIRDNKLLKPYVALARCGLESFLPLANSLLGEVSGQYRQTIEQRGDDSADLFRRQLAQRIEQFAHEIYTRTGPMPEIEAFVVQNTKFLRKEATWSRLLQNAYPSVIPEAQANQSIWASLTAKTNTSGLARNPYCMGISADTVQTFLYSDRILGRDPQMQAVSRFPTEPGWKLPRTVAAEQVPTFLAQCPPSLRTIYEKCRLTDGSIQVLEIFEPLLTAVDPAGFGGLVGSADCSPVIAVRPEFNRFQGNLVYCRGLFANAFGGQVLREAAIALGIAGAAAQRPEKLGAWLSLRLPGIYPIGDDLLSTVANWTEALQTATEDSSAQLNKAIETMQARGVQLQQLIRRIDAIVASLAGDSYRLSPCSAMVTISNGTAGLVADLVASEGKPQDPPTAYGGGAVLVVPLPVVGTVMFDFLKSLFQLTEGPVDSLGVVPDTLGIGGSPDVPPDDPVPDVL